MIYRDSTVTMSKGTSTIDSPIILYRGDREVEINFTIQDSPFRYRTGSATNLIEKTEADYGQLIIKTPNNRKPIFSKITATDEGKIILKITADMIDEIEEVGKYDFQIRLFDSEQVSKVTIPPVEGGIEIREPIAIEDVTDTNEVNVATVGYALTTAGTSEDAFDSQGNYNKTTWATGDRITSDKLNKIEAGIDGVNKKVASSGEVDLSGYATLDDIPTNTSQLTNDSGYITSIPSEYITEAELKDKGYLTEHQDITGKVDKVDGKGLSTNDLTTTLKQNYDNAYAHSQSTHAPSNAQRNSDITKEEIEAKLTGEITTHTHKSTLDKITEDKINSLDNKLNYITPECFGAKGDGVTDDTLALNETISHAISNSLSIKLEKKYKITETLIFRGNLKVIGKNATLVYTGSEYAVKVTNSSNAYIEIGEITSENGGCIEIFSSSNDDYVQYLTLVGKELRCKTKCIFFNTTGGWTNEIDIKCYRFGDGEYGIYADALGDDRINGVTTTDVSVEGVSRGFYIANNCTCWSLINTRHLEGCTSLIETVGKVTLTIIGYSLFYFSRDEVKFSSQTSGHIVSPIVTNDGVIISFQAEITFGVVVPTNYRNYMNLYNKNDSFTLSKEAFYNYILVNSNLNSLTLSKAYGIYNGVNEFVIRCDFDNGHDFTIYDSNKNIIFNNTEETGWSYLHFQWFADIGWRVEKKSYITRIATEDTTNTNEVNVATVGYALTTAGTSEDVFDSQGNYNKTTWGTGDRITSDKLNKLEEGVYKNSTTKFDDIELSGNELNMKVNGTVKKTVTLPNTGGSGGSVAWESITGKPATFTPSSHSHSKSDITDFPTIPTVSNDLTNALKTNYDNAYAHSQSTHAPSNAQRNSDITKEEIEAKLTGEITTHTHNEYTGGKKQRFLTQQEYNNLSSTGQLDSNTVYNITDVPIGIIVKKVTQQQYDTESHDANTLYVIVG